VEKIWKIPFYCFFYPILTKQKEIVEQLKKLEKMKNYSQVREQSTDMMEAVIILVHHSIQEKISKKFFFCECKQAET
jgi:hypothetical protein